MSEAELNPTRSRNIKKILIILFSIVSLGAIITIVTLILINAGINAVNNGDSG